MGGKREPRSGKEVSTLERGLVERGLLGPLRALCKAYSVTLDDVLAGINSTRIVRGRDACAHLLLGKGFSTTEAGKLLGMHHTSIIAARQRFEKRDMGRLIE